LNESGECRHQRDGARLARFPPLKHFVVSSPTWTNLRWGRTAMHAHYAPQRLAKCQHNSGSRKEDNVRPASRGCGADPDQLWDVGRVQTRATGGRTSCARPMPIGYAATDTLIAHRKRWSENQSAMSLQSNDRHRADPGNTATDSGPARSLGECADNRPQAPSRRGRHSAPADHLTSAPAGRPGGPQFPHEPPIRSHQMPRRT
jgi:hypothetical protein